MDISHAKVIFFGSSEFALPIFESLLNERVKILVVVTQPDKPSGREGLPAPTPLKIRARSHKLEVLQFDSLAKPGVAEQLKSFHADFAVVASFGQIIPKEVLRVTRRDFINIHPSLLPKYRGPSPIHYALLNGESVTGTSIMILDEKMDHGPLLAQQRVAVESDDTYTKLHDRLAHASAELLIQVLPPWLEGVLESHRQDDRLATFTKLLTRQDGKILWKNPAEHIDRRIRALTPWPGTWTTLDGERYKILKARLGFPKPIPLPGQLLVIGKKIFVGCGNFSALEILSLQPASKPELSAEQYINGYRANSGKYFE